jgi:hypothetical protein
MQNALPSGYHSNNAPSSCLLIVASALFILGSFIFMIILLAKLPSHDEQAKFKKMLSHEIKATNRRIAQQIVALPVAIIQQTKNLEDNVYVAL